MSRTIDGLITFLYYDDLERATGFYEEIIGLKLVIDQGWAKIFKVSENAHIGLVDGKRGYHRPSPIKPVMITLIVPDVDSWYNYLKERNVKILSEPRDNKELNIRTLLIEDPEGYVIEIEHFY
ncbi:MAG: VOC family protein [Candidatus Bathyarchaeia archaeon]